MKLIEQCKRHHRDNAWIHKERERAVIFTAPPISISSACMKPSNLRTLTEVVRHSYDYVFPLILSLSRNYTKCINWCYLLRLLF